MSSGILVRSICLSQFGLLQQSTADCVAYKQQSRSWKSKIRAPARLGSGENPLPSCRLPGSRHGRERETPLGSLSYGHEPHSRGLRLCDLITSQRPHPRRPSYRGLGISTCESWGDTNIQSIVSSAALALSAGGYWCLGLTSHGHKTAATAPGITSAHNCPK